MRFPTFNLDSANPTLGFTSPDEATTFFHRCGFQAVPLGYAPRERGNGIINYIVSVTFETFFLVCERYPEFALFVQGRSVAEAPAAAAPQQQEPPVMPNRDLLDYLRYVAAQGGGISKALEVIQGRLQIDTDLEEEFNARFASKYGFELKDNAVTLSVLDIPVTIPSLPDDTYVNYADLQKIWNDARQRGVEARDPFNRDPFTFADIRPAQEVYDSAMKLVNEMLIEKIKPHVLAQLTLEELETLLAQKTQRTSSSPAATSSAATNSSAFFGAAPVGGSASTAVPTHGATQNTNGL